MLMDDEVQSRVTKEGYGCLDAREEEKPSAGRSENNAGCTTWDHSVCSQHGAGCILTLPLPLPPAQASSAANGHRHV